MRGAPAADARHAADRTMLDVEADGEVGARGA